MSDSSNIIEVVTNASNYANWELKNKVSVGKQCYTILLVLTDGQLDEIDDTKKAICEASKSPLSIVIVGIGEKDFQTMQNLDDFVQEEHIYGVRDIVQFVEFTANNYSKNALNRAVFEEIPSQVVEYFQSKGIPPNPPEKTRDIVVDDFDANSNLEFTFDFSGDSIRVKRKNEQRFSDLSSRWDDEYNLNGREEEASGRNMERQQSFCMTIIDRLRCMKR